MKTITTLIIVFFSTLAFSETSQQIKHLELSTKGINTLEIHCGAGSLKVKGDRDLAIIRVTARIEVENFQEEDLQNFIDTSVKLDLMKGNNKAVLLSVIQNQPQNMIDARINLEVETPFNLNAKIFDGSGSVVVDNFTGNLLIKDDTGKIKVDNVVGAVTIDDGSGSIVIENIKGNVRVKDGSGSIRVDYIIGDVFVIDGSGDMVLRHITGNVNVTDGSGDIDISEISQNVYIGDAGSGELNTVRIKGKLNVRE